MRKFATIGAVVLTLLSATRNAAAAQSTLAWDNLDWISPRPVLFITGDRAHSRIFSERDKLTSFFTQHLRSAQTGSQPCRPAS